DLRRSLRTRSYCITLGLAFLAALWVQFHAVSDAAGYDHFSTGVKLAFIAVTLFWFIIPNRAGAAVSADAGVRGTNFLTLTPLGSRSIILQMWLSAAAQIVVTAAVGSLFLVWRHALPMEAQHSTISLLNSTPSTPAQDWVAYGIIVLCGLVMCAVSLFLAQLNRIFRIAGLIFVLSLLWGWVQENLALLLHPNPQGYLLGRMAAEDWVALAAMALLSIAALLELARRCYAAPAENCSRALRLLVLLPLLCSVAMYITQLPHANRIAVENTLTFSVYFALAVCMSDALLPAPTHRNRAESLLPWVPRYLQQNGSGPAALFLALVLLAATGVQCLTEPAGHSETHIVRLFTETAARSLLPTGRAIVNGYAMQAFQPQSPGIWRLAFGGNRVAFQYATGRPKLHPSRYSRLAAPRLRIFCPPHRVACLAPCRHPHACHIGHDFIPGQAIKGCSPLPPFFTTVAAPAATISLLTVGEQYKKLALRMSGCRTATPRLRTGISERKATKI
ncbi:MAG: hypothetical protein IKC90_00825, partial [Akkermansia sp.]|nr:hypothetical protein [Akkermansia sp.]